MDITNPASPALQAGPRTAPSLTGGLIARLVTLSQTQRHNRYDPRVSSPARRIRTREQRERTRREILAAAERFLRESPHRDLSVEGVMAQTGLTRTAFYRHFDDVTDLMLRLMDELRRELLTTAERW